MDLKIVGELEGDRRSDDIGGGRRDICPPSALGSRGRPSQLERGEECDIRRRKKYSAKSRQF